MATYIHPSPDAGMAFFKAYSGKGKIVMLNLLRFKEVADYSDMKHLKPNEPVSGKEAYERYMEYTLPLLEKAGSKVLFAGDCGPFVIGPENEAWDLALLVEHQSVEKFTAFAQDEEYLKTAGHRTAALADSRLLPITQ